MSDTAAAIRYFCLVLPNGGASLGFDYLEAFAQTGHSVRACPIGPAFLMAEPWIKIHPLFSPGGFADRYVNVVVAPPNLLMGTRLRVTDVKAPGHLPGPGEETAPFALSAPQAGDPAADVIYEPQTALGGLFTVGVPNIAITMPRPKPPEEHEVRALCQYDAVIAPTADDASTLRHLGIVAFHVPADPGQLGRIVSWLLKTEPMYAVAE